MDLDTGETDDFLSFCLKCTSYVMTNRSNVAQILSFHRCEATENRTKNTAFCMHQIIDAMKVCGINNAKESIQIPAYSFHTFAISSAAVYNSSIRNENSDVHMASTTDDSIEENNFNMHRITTSTPTTEVEAKNYVR